MKTNRIKNELENIARYRVPESINLWPEIESRFNKRNSFMQTLRARPVMTIVILMLALSLLTGVVYAIGKAIGYVPGVGLVDQNVPLRVLGEPITETRDGVTLIISDVILGSDSTYISYEVKSVQGGLEKCWSTPSIKLSIDTVFMGMSGGSTNTYYEGDITFGPVPPELNDVTLLFDCEDNWEIPLHFVPAPSDMIIAPVVEVEIPTSDTSNTLILEKTIETTNGYILVGRFDSAGLQKGVIVNGVSIWDPPIIMDATGQMVLYTSPSGLALTGGTGNYPWAFEIQGKEHNWPLTLIFNAIQAHIPDTYTEFEFDTGPTPQGGQRWIIDRDILIGEFMVHLNYILHTGKGYKFQFADNHSVASIGINILNPENTGSPSPNGNGGNGSDGLISTIYYNEEAPSGKMTIRLFLEDVNLQGLWQLQWQP